MVYLKKYSIFSLVPLGRDIPILIICYQGDPENFNFSIEHIPGPGSSLWPRCGPAAIPVALIEFRVGISSSGKNINFFSHFYTFFRENRSKVKKNRKNRLIQYMRVIKKPFNNPDTRATITGVVEVLLPPELRSRLVKVKQSNPRLTYSYIARYCLFRLLRHKKFFSKKRFIDLYDQDSLTCKSRITCQRLRMCLYGDDESMFQLLSNEMRIDMSKFVRIALLWYLPEFEKFSILPEKSNEVRELRKIASTSFEKVKLFGTKVIKKLNNFTKEDNYRPLKVLYTSSFYSGIDFW